MASIEELVAVYKAKLIAEAAAAQIDADKQGGRPVLSKPLQRDDMDGAGLQKEPQVGRNGLQRGLKLDALPIDGYGSSSESEDSDGPGAELAAQNIEGDAQQNASDQAATNKTSRRRKRYQPPGYTKAQSKRGWKLLRRVIDERFIPTGLTFEKLPKDLKKKELSDFKQSFPNFFPDKQALHRYVGRHMTRKKSYANLSPAERRAHIEKAAASKKRRKGESGGSSRGTGEAGVQSGKRRRLVKLVEMQGGGLGGQGSQRADADTLPSGGLTPDKASGETHETELATSVGLNRPESAPAADLNLGLGFDSTKAVLKEFSPNMAIPQRPQSATASGSGLPNIRYKLVASPGRAHLPVGATTVSSEVKSSSAKESPKLPSHRRDAAAWKTRLRKAVQVFEIGLEDYRQGLQLLAGITSDSAGAPSLLEAFVNSPLGECISTVGLLKMDSEDVVENTTMLELATIMQDLFGESASAFRKTDATTQPSIAAASRPSLDCAAPSGVQNSNDLGPVLEKRKDTADPSPPPLARTREDLGPVLEKRKDTADPSPPPLARTREDSGPVPEKRKDTANPPAPSLAQTREDLGLVPDKRKVTANPPPPPLARTREPRTTAGQTSVFRDFQIAGNGPASAVASGKDGKPPGKPKGPGSNAKKQPEAVHLFLPRKGKPKVFVGTGHVYYTRADQTVGGKPLGEGRVGVILEETDDLAATLEVPEGFATCVARSKKRQLTVAGLPLKSMIDWQKAYTESKG